MFGSAVLATALTVAGVLGLAARGDDSAPSPSDKARRVASALIPSG
jgi:hypothetical protein